MTDLRSLTREPFKLLQELERLGRTAAVGDGETAGADAAEWVGVAFKLGSEQFVAPRDQVREILMVPEVIVRVPGAKSWVRGVANVRGHLLAVTDLRAFLGGGAASRGRNARILVANHREIPAGLIVDEVLGFRRFLEEEYDEQAVPTILRAERYLDGCFRRAGDAWPVFDVFMLLESEMYQQAAEVG